jgi:hypothetical protein
MTADLIARSHRVSPSASPVAGSSDEAIQSVLKAVIPGWREAPGFDVQLHIRESITTIGRMDSGPPLSRLPE